MTASFAAARHLLKRGKSPEVSMFSVVEGFDQAGLSLALRRLRAHAAVVRTLLDELERATPCASCAAELVRLSRLAEDLAEELTSLSRRMLVCATVATSRATSRVPL